MNEASPPATEDEPSKRVAANRSRIAGLVAQARHELEVAADYEQRMSSNMDAFLLRHPDSLSAAEARKRLDRVKGGHESITEFMRSSGLDPGRFGVLPARVVEATISAWIRHLFDSRDPLAGPVYRAFPDVSC